MQYVAVAIAATEGVADDEQGLAGGLFNTGQQVGAALGVATRVAVATARTATLSPGNGGLGGFAALVGGFQTALLTAVGFAVLAVVVSLFVVREVRVPRGKTTRYEEGERSAGGGVAALPVEGEVRPTSFTSPDAVGHAGAQCPEPWNEEHVRVAVRNDLEAVRMMVHNAGRRRRIWQRHVHIRNGGTKHERRIHFAGVPRPSPTG